MIAVRTTLLNRPSLIFLIKSSENAKLRFVFSQFGARQAACPDSAKSAARPLFRSVRRGHRPTFSVCCSICEYFATLSRTYCRRTLVLVSEDRPIVSVSPCPVFAWRNALRTQVFDLQCIRSVRAPSAAQATAGPNRDLRRQNNDEDMCFMTKHILARV